LTIRDEAGKEITSKEVKQVEKIDQEPSPDKGFDPLPKGKLLDNEGAAGGSGSSTSKGGSASSTSANKMSTSKGAAVPAAPTNLALGLLAGFAGALM